ncbi:DUF294 nucleotidyltransferase-like domain-containing protein [Microbulbifer sp. MLAF003]|uniref:DUF294 nucleotidyltransferase-like domain-containing protein n=1 Tax=Microbulbifer sp. MLAF003 TaxID=3032582 RepID=UPI0024ACC9DF|nr:DUF294 nucleotidyltransferase-like domain-containing protein [Microbulbifer sp. MLAF003]WHI49217.1 DUF294 nucleotidyltransferase-like domain-containing protein [Microbulbifer sp. MLAF003]
MLDNEKTAWQMMSSWTKKLVGFIERLYKDQFTIHSRPSDFSFCITGSGARGEACPQSDLDAFIVIPKITQNQRETWRKINLAVQKRLDNINDSRIKTLRPGKGFVFCTGGLNPLGMVTKKWMERNNKDGLIKKDRVIFDLTNTAAALTGLLEEYYQYPSDPKRYLRKHIVSGLQECAHAFGNPKLHRELVDEVKFVLGKQAIEFGSNSLLTRKRKQGLQAMEVAINDKNFQPPAPYSDIKRVKREFYRAPQFILKGLAWFYDIDEVSSLAQLSKLEEMGKLHPTRAVHFRKAMSEALRVRVASHIVTGAEFDKVLSAYVTPNRDQSAWLRLNPEQSELLEDAANSVRLIIGWADEFTTSQGRAHGIRYNPFSEPFLIK